MGKKIERKEVFPKEKEFPKEDLEESPKEVSSGRQELYFFPNYMKTISAGSLQEATAKLKEGEE